MAKARYPITPMTLGNMRELGVRSLAVTCELCHHARVLSVDGWLDAVLVHIPSRVRLSRQETQRSMRK